MKHAVPVSNSSNQIQQPPKRIKTILYHLCLLTNQITYTIHSVSFSALLIFYTSSLSTPRHPTVSQWPTLDRHA